MPNDREKKLLYAIDDAEREYRQFKIVVSVGAGLSTMFLVMLLLSFPLNAIYGKGWTVMFGFTGFLGLVLSTAATAAFYDSMRYTPVQLTKARREFNDYITQERGT